MLLRLPFRALRLRTRGERRFSGNASGMVMSFGDGTHGALGLPSSSGGFGSDAYEPTRIPGLPCDVSSVIAGHYHSLAVTSNGQVWSWGRNNDAQLGRGLLVSRSSLTEPMRVNGLDNVKVRSAVASGVISAALGHNGSLWVWGKSKRGQLGLGKQITESILPSRVEALANENIVKVSLGWGHALALTEDGKLFGWGYSAQGRLGQIGRHFEKSATNLSIQYTRIQQLEIAEKLVLKEMEMEKDMPIIWEPCLLEELRDGVEVVDIACGLDHSLVLCCDGTLLSGGDNTYGQLGRENHESGFFPIKITQPHPISVASGLGHSLAICANPKNGETSILSWGWNAGSQLGRRGCESSPSVVEGMEGEITIMVSGGRVHSLALTSEGRVWCWGSGKNGRLGLGRPRDECEPVLIECLEGVEVLEVVSGFDHSLLLAKE